MKLHLSSIAANVSAMGVAITVRNVPDEVRDELAARAARAGKSLQEYLRGMLIDSAARPPVADVIARARARVDATGVRADAESILAARDADRR
jgi:plasmid stability protein